MKSPITNKEMILKQEDKTLTYRKEDFTIKYHFYFCEESGEKFTTTALDEINILQVHNQYRYKHNLPFPHEIIAIREKYNIAASKMSEILGFGTNVYREYENGEIPNKSNGKMIRLINDPKQFRFLVNMSESLSSSSKEDLLAHIDSLISKEKSWEKIVNQFLFKQPYPDYFSGFRVPSIEKIAEMVVYFSKELKPWTTQLNKLMFYADFKCYKESCLSMSGLQYRAIDLGPVPNNYNSIYEHLQNEGAIQMEETLFSNGESGLKFLPCRDFNSELFTAQELKILEQVKARFKNVKTADIINISHTETAWLAHEKNKSIIDYTYAFDLKNL